jgi:hypothetical protein
MLTDILIASKDEASTIFDQYPQRKDWSSLELKGLDNFKLAALLTVLGSTAEAEALEGEECLITSNEDGPWLFLLPIAFRDKLAALPTSEFRAIAVRWVAHEELAIDRWSVEDVEPGISMLSEHAKKSVEAGKDLLLWMSL